MYFTAETDRINKKAEDTKKKLLEMRKQAQEQFGVIFDNQNPFELRETETKDSIRNLDEEAWMYRTFKKNKEKVYIDFSKKGEYMLDNSSFKTLLNLQCQRQIDNDKIETSCQSYQLLIDRSLKSVLSQRFDRVKNNLKGISPRGTSVKERSNTIRARTITLTKRKTMGLQPKIEYEKLMTEQRRLLKTSHLERFHKDRLQQEFQDVVEELNNTKQKKKVSLMEAYKKKFFF